MPTLLSSPIQQSAERCVSTLLDLIQTKVNYVVQEAIVVIKDIFRKYPNKYALTPLPSFKGSSGFSLLPLSCPCAPKAKIRVKMEQIHLKPSLLTTSRGLVGQLAMGLPRSDCGGCLSSHAVVPWSPRYESVIATLCENLDSLDEPEARAAMIWIVGEYAERIDNADELLESFLEGFHDESTQVGHRAGWVRSLPQPVAHPALTVISLLHCRCGQTGCVRERCDPFPQGHMRCSWWYG